MNLKRVLILTIWISNQIYAQTDTLKYQWPVEPLNTSHSINGNFSEYRNTLSSDHFHNAVDIGKADGEPCYAAMDGEVFTINNSGSNAYVRVVTPSGAQYKHLTYLHITPNPALSVGDPVSSGVTILGTIYPGMGHVHLIERELVSQIGFYAAEINNTRQNGGLTPYIDPDPPVIERSSLKFYIDGTNTEIPSYGLSGNVDIQIKIEEHNGPGDVHQNNGTYIAGYRVWNHDTSLVVYEPDDLGVKYRFDRKPSNSYVNLAFVDEVATLSNPVYWLTNGDGANYINQSQEVTNNYFQTSLLDTGNYVLEIFSEDTRENQDVEFFNITVTDQDITSPARPEIYYVLNSDNNQSLEIKWVANTENDLLGYRLYFSSDNLLSTWELAADESQLTSDMTLFYLNSPDSFMVEPEQEAYFFLLKAVDSSGNESNASDIYARSTHSDGSDKKQALIVNGFTRWAGSGSWQSPVHSFVKAYFDPLIAADSVVISSCSNESVIENITSLNDYDFVVWFVGDESTVDNTFTATEQAKIKLYLENSGKLFVSGSEIGWDLGRSHNLSEAGDQDFYHNYLKANYVYDGNSSMSSAIGAVGSGIEDLQFTFGQVYPEDYPDDIDPLNGSQLFMRYNQIRSESTYRKAGIVYSGTFGQSQQQAQLVYLAFPFETINSLLQRQVLMTAILGYFNVVTSIDGLKEEYPEKFSISQNYPNPFNSSTQFSIRLPRKGRVEISVFDMLGRNVHTIENSNLAAGEYTFTWNAEGFASGLYVLKIMAGNIIQSKKMILLK